MLPHIENRPLSLVRCPDGVGGPRFFQKHAAGGTPDALKRIPIREKDETEEARGAIKTLGGEIEDIKRYSLPGGDKRTLVIIKKVSPAPAQYPRVSAKIAKKPL